MSSFALSQAIYFHIIIIYFLFAIALINAIVLFFLKDFVGINKLSWAFTPLFLGFLFIAFLSGISIWAMMKFSFSFKILFMILANCVFLLEIFRIKKLRKARIKPHFRAKYMRFARIVNLIYLAIFSAFLVF